MDESNRPDLESCLSSGVGQENVERDEDGHLTPQCLDKLSPRSSRDLSRAQDAIVRVMSGRSRKSVKPVSSMGGGRGSPPPPPVPDREPYRVDFDGPDDPAHPFNWSLRRKVLICGCLGYANGCVGWGSSVFASAVPFVCEEFHVGEVVGILGISLYVFGFASGPILWGPFSELYGRKGPLVVSMFGCTVFSFAVATAKDFQTIMLCRFFGGFLGAGPLTVVGAAFADMFDNRTRGTAIAIFAFTITAFPILAPVVGGFISYSYLGWRWTEYITGIMSSTAVILVICFYQESYHPVILVQKAREIRRQTGNWAIFAPHEEVELDLSEIVEKTMSRPIMMLVTEPILLLLTVYLTFVYGLLYLCLEAYPLIFVESYHFQKGIIELPYIGLLVGMVIAALLSIFVFEPRYNRQISRNNWMPLPEARLPFMMIGSIAFPIGVFWLTWSGNYPEKVHWAVPTVSGLFIGFGLQAIFLPGFNYIIDTYLVFAASAIAANTFLRSGGGAGFPLFAGAMFNNLGINWAGTVLGCIAVAMVPIPFLFAKYGKRIRQHSKYAIVLDP